MHLQSGAEPVTRLCLGRDGVIHDVKHGLSRELGLLINELYNSTFKKIFQPGTIPFSFIEEMGNSGMVAGAEGYVVIGMPYFGGFQGWIRKIMFTDEGKTEINHMHNIASMNLYKWLKMVIL